MPISPIRLRGLDPAKRYTVPETNLVPGTKSPIDPFAAYSGDFLMTASLSPAVSNRRTSVVLDMTEQGGEFL